MEILYLLIPLGVVLMAVAGAALVWAARSGQFDDLDEIGRHPPDREP